MLATQFFASGTIVAGAAFVLKLWMERLFDSRFKELEERTKAQIAEGSRRDAAIYDQQFESLKTALSLVYRARNIAREIQNSPEESNTRDGQKQFDQLVGYDQSIGGLLFMERAILPSDLFRKLHGLRHELHGFKVIVDEYRRIRQRGSRDERLGRVADELRQVYGRLDAQYEQLTLAIQDQIGVQKGIGLLSNALGPATRSVSNVESSRPEP
jgi:hypothetical protein